MYRSLQQFENVENISMIFIFFTEFFELYVHIHRCFEGLGIYF